MNTLTEKLHEDRTERGASAVEYGLLLAGIAALIVLAVFAFGGTLKYLFSDSCGTIGGTITAHSSTSSASSCP